MAEARVKLAEFNLSNNLGSSARKRLKKNDKTTKKIIIREIAEDLGLPKEFAWRKKKAAQNGLKARAARVPDEWRKWFAYSAIKSRIQVSSRGRLIKYATFKLDIEGNVASHEKLLKGGWCEMYCE